MVRLIANGSASSVPLPLLLPVFFPLPLADSELSNEKWPILMVDSQSNGFRSPFSNCRSFVCLMPTNLAWTQSLSLLLPDWLTVTLTDQLSVCLTDWATCWWTRLVSGLTSATYTLNNHLTSIVASKRRRKKTKCKRQCQWLTFALHPIFLHILLLLSTSLITLASLCLLCVYLLYVNT